MDWPRIDITTNHLTGEKTISYSQTPEEFVEHLREQGECLFVTNRSCPECHYFQESHIVPAMKREMETDMVALHQLPECVCATVAHFQSRYEVPDLVVCYGFYYQHVHENKYLQAAKEADLIAFFDITGYPGLRETGLKLIDSDWNYSQRPIHPKSKES